MKYIIELTDTEYNVLTGFMDMISSEIKAKYFQKAKLKPIKIRTTNVKDTKEYQIGYKEGFADGKADAIYNTDIIDELKQVEYIRGYNTAINDYNGMIQWLHDCRDNFKEFMNKKYGYDIMYLTNPKVDEGVMLYDLICDHDIAEVISKFQKWEEEKKKAAEESIKVGDEVIIKDQETIGVITMLANNNYTVICLINGSEMARVTKNDIKPTGRHFDEVGQLLDKLRGEENEKN